MAHVMKQHLPVTLLAMIDNNTWPGECLMVQGNPIARPTSAEISQNYVFVKPLVKVCPRFAPCSSFSICQLCQCLFPAEPISIGIGFNTDQVISKFGFTILMLLMVGKISGFNLLSHRPGAVGLLSH